MWEDQGRLTAADLRNLVADSHADYLDPDDPNDFDDPDMLNFAYSGRPGCETALARLFGVEPLQGHYSIDSASWMRPEPDEVLRQECLDKIKGKTRVDGLSLTICGEVFDVAQGYSTTLKPEDVIPYLQDVDIEDDPRIEGAEYLVRPGAEATVAAMFGVEPVEGQYTVGATYWYE